MTTQTPTTDDDLDMDYGSAMAGDILGDALQHVSSLAANLPAENTTGDYMDDLLPGDPDPVADEAAAAAAAAATAEAEAAAAQAEADAAALAAAKAEADALAAAAADTAATPKKEYMIPKSRLDQEAQARRAAETRAMELENRILMLERGGVPGIDLPDHTEAMKLYNDALLDGKNDIAAQIMNEIQAKNAAAVARQTAETVRAEMRREAQGAALETVISELETKFDFLNNASPNYNPDITGEILDLHELYVRKGFAPADAMRKASDMVLKVSAPAPASAPAEPAAPAPAAPAAPSTQDVVRAAREAQARVNATKIAAQPTAEPARSEASPAMALDIENMSDEEFNALPLSKIRELRGDFALGRPG